MEYCAENIPAYKPISRLRLPHPRGRLDRRAGARLHAGRRLRLRGAGPVPRPGHRAVRARAVVLLRRAPRLLRGDRQVPRRPPDLGPLAARRLRRDDREGPAAALPHPDRRGVASPPSSRTTTSSGRRSRRCRRPRRHPVAAHQRPRRGARPAQREGRPDRAAHPAGDHGGDGGHERGRPARRLLVRRGAHRRASSARRRRSSPASRTWAPTAR